jgi:adenylate cyclase
VAILLVREKNNVIDRIPLYKDVFYIGRALENDLILTDTASSRKHSRITKSGSNFFLEDLSSANGTLINGRDVKGKHQFREGDVVKIGDTELVYQDQAHRPRAHMGGSDLARELGTSQIIKPVTGVSYDLEKSIADLSASIVQERSIVTEPDAPEEAIKDANFRIMFQLGKILTSTGTLDELIETGMRLVMEVLKADRGILKTFDPATEKLVTRATRIKGDIKRFAGNIEISSTISSKVIREKVAIMTADAKSDPRFLQGQSIVTFNIRGALCVPLWDEENVRGIVYVDNLTEANTFTEGDLDLLAAVAHQIAVGIKKEELNEKIRHEAVVRSNLERFHSKEELEVILEHAHKGDGEAEFSMRESEASVLFSDICSFTPMSESMKPTEVANLLNRYFSTMTKIIFKNKGSVNKYVGDGIIATFGAFSDTDTGAENAVRAGCEMIAALMEMNKRFQLDVRFRIRVGINTGPVVVGMLGPVERMEFTVLGDTVNVASRLETAARPMSVCFGERTFRETGAKFRVQQLGEAQLKGKAKAEKIFGILFE